MSGKRGGNDTAPTGKDRRQPLVDAADRLRAIHDFSESLCVEAGAGTGKTKLLIDRFLEIIRTGKARCTQVVAITFTEKAAGEMKIRLREEIEALLGGEAIDDVERERLTAARDDLERAPISTIHSFASAILREHPIEAGIDPLFVQLDALEGSLCIEECWEAFLERVSPPFDSLLRRFMLFGVGIDQVRDVAIGMYERRGERYVSGIPGMDRWADGGGGGPAPGRDGPGSVRSGHGVPPAGAVRPGSADLDVAAILDDFSGAVALRSGLVARAGALTALAGAHCTDESDPGYRVINDFGAALDGMEDLEDGELEDFLVSVSPPRLNAGNKSNWSPDDTCAEQKRLIREVRQVLEEYRGRVADKLRDALRVWLEAFTGFVDERKAADGVLDFDDLLIRTRILLRDESALQSLRRRYRYILVDEFQDTDPLQAEIILMLAGGERTSGAAAIEQGKLFVVGDPKQSIYRFRRADVEIYEEVKELLSRTGSHLKIVQNFRSVPGITGWVNGAFSVIIQKPAKGRFQPSYEPIHPHRTGGGPAVIQLDLEMPAADAAVGEVRRHEGEAIVRAIRRLVAEGRAVGDAERGTQHRVRYGDIAVLYPGTTGIDFYEDPIRAEGIPYIVEGGKLYYTRQEVRDLAAALWSVEDPWDSLSLVATLRSPLFGFSDEEIFLYVRSGGRLRYLDGGPPRDGRFADIAAAFDLLAELHRRRNEHGPAGTLRRLLRRTGYRELSVLRTHGEQRLLNIEKAVQIARAFEGGAHSYRRFAEWFRRQEMLGAVESESPVVDESEDAVRLITIHKSKGLQFPVVIMANLVQRRTRSSGIILERGARLAFKLGSELKTSDFETLKERERERDEAEVARLLYVAATRAGDILVVPRVERRGSFFELIDPHLPGGCHGAGGSDTAGSVASGDGAGRNGDPPRNGTGGTGVPAGVETWRVSELPPLRGEAGLFVGLPRLDGHERERAARRKNEWISARDGMIERGKRCPVVITPSGMERAAAEEAVGAGDDSRTGGARRGAVPGPGRKAANGAERALGIGSAFHRLMETVDLAGTGDISTLAAAAASEHGIPGDATELENLARRAIAADPVRRASRSGRVLREVPFTLSIELVSEDRSGRGGGERAGARPAVSGRVTGGSRLPLSLSLPGIAAGAPARHLLEGRIDLLFEHDGVWTALDYKTDAVEADEVDARFLTYRTQGILYATALARFGFTLGGGVLFYFVRPDQVRRLAVDGALLEEGEGLVREALLAHLT